MYAYIITHTHAYIVYITTHTHIRIFGTYTQTHIRIFGIDKTHILYVYHVYSYYNAHTHVYVYTHNTHTHSLRLCRNAGAYSRDMSIVYVILCVWKTHVYVILCMWKTHVHIIYAYQNIYIYIYIYNTYLCIYVYIYIHICIYVYTHLLCMSYCVCERHTRISCRFPTHTQTWIVHTDNPNTRAAATPTCLSLLCYFSKNLEIPIQCLFYSFSSGP